MTEAACNVRVYIDALGRLGYRTEALLRAAGLNQRDLDDPDGRIPCAAVGALFGYAMQERPLRNLGTRIAAETPIGAFPLIDYLILSSEDVGRGLLQLSRYFRLVDFPVTLHFLEREESVRVIYEGPPSPFGYEFGIALCVLHLREETENRFNPECVSFTHNPDDAEDIERTLGCPVFPRSSWVGFALSRQAWNLPLRRRDPILHGVLERHAKEMVRGLTGIGGTALEVRRVLTSRVTGGDTRIGRIAHALGRSARSLQRQLSAEGCSYQMLVDAARRQAAERYLAESALPIAEVAYLLGYSEVAAFHRAFKRWTGSTPQTFRQSRRSSQEEKRT
jgi:AraC-like DNA-binding protein